MKAFKPILAEKLNPLPIWQLCLLMGVALVLWLLIRIEGNAPWQNVLKRILSVTGTLLVVACGLNLSLAGVLAFFPETTLGVEPPWPLWTTVLLAGGLIAFVLTTYPPRIRHLPPWPRRILLTLRLAAAALICFAMFRPHLEKKNDDQRNVLFAIIRDVSRSMNTRDSTGGTSRAESVLKVIEENADLLEQLSKQVQLVYYDLGRDLTPAADWKSKSDAAQTALGHGLDQLVRLNPTQRILGALVLSDGAQRAMPPYDLDPRLAAERLYDRRVPVHTAAFGSSSFAETAMDLAAEDLQVNPTVFVKNRLIVGARIRALGAEGRDLKVRLLVEEPGATGEPAKMALQGLPATIRPSSSDDIIPVELSYVPQLPGEYRIAVEVTPLDGEPVVTNNTISTYITVLKGGLSVAYFDWKRPEQKFLRQINESPDIQVDFRETRLSKRGSTPDMEPDWFVPGKYDVYVIGDVPARAFRINGDGEQPLEWLRKAVEQGAGLMMTGGFHSFGPGGYASSPLEAVLPVTMQPQESGSEGTPDPTLHYLSPVKMVPTSQGLRHFVMRLDSPDKNRARWESLAPLEGANRFGQLKPLAVPLAVTPVGADPSAAPLLVGQDVGRGRVLAFAGDTTFQWVLAGHGDLHQQFWRQVILWLAHKEDQGDSSVWVRLNQRRLRPGQTLEMTFGARNAEGLPVNDADFSVSVAGPDGRTEMATQQVINEEHFGSFASTLKPGEYTVRVEARLREQSLGPAVQSRFLVFDQDLELDNPAADFSLLDEVSRATSGSVVPPERLGDFLRGLLSSGMRAEVESVQRTTLWDNWMVLVTFVTIMSGEWFYRKWRGLV